jgi:citrate lyase subunit beta / citryl-CoA lyase
VSALGDATYARRLGFTATLCVHPRQVAAVTPVYVPTPAEQDRARAVLDAVRAARGGVTVVDGRMVDAPVVARGRLLTPSADPTPTKGPTS